MARFLKSFRKAKGAAPGSLIFIGKQSMEKSRIRLFKYDRNTFSEKEYKTIEEALKHIDPAMKNWLNIDGLHDTSIVRKIGKHFDISGLVLDNVLNTGQRPKFFDYRNAVTVIAKAVYYNEETNGVSGEQISFILCRNAIISFQEKPGDHFDPVRDRIRKDIGLIRESSEDYLLYNLLDSLVDNYLINIEQMGSKIEDLEKRLATPDKELSKELFHYKTEVTYFRKIVRPLKEVMTRFVRSDSVFISKQTHIYFQELSDMVEQAIDSIDLYFGMIGDQLNLYNTNINNRANDVMKVLTIFASIFIPLTFIAGVYGTNFDFIPELHFRYSYFLMLSVMAVVAGFMLYYFRKNKWF